MSDRIVLHADMRSPEALAALLAVVREHWPEATLEVNERSDHSGTPLSVVSVVLDGALFIDAFHP